MQRPTYSRWFASSSRPAPSQGLDRTTKVPGVVGETSAREAYDRFAPVYDEFNAQNDYEHWLGEILLPELERHGLEEGRTLDVGCGTGRAFDPLLDRQWEVVGCDASPEMVRRAQAKFPGSDDPRKTNRGRLTQIVVADARQLPLFGKPFHLILALNDVVNYLTEDGDLEAFLEGVKRNLAPGGLVCFDANSLSVYEEAWLAGKYGAMRQRGWEWTGLSEQAVAGGVFEAEVSGEGIEPNIHRQRHWTRDRIVEAMVASGLRCLTILGQREEEGEILLEEVPSEQRHYKMIYIGAHRG